MDTFIIFIFWVMYGKTRGSSGSLRVPQFESITKRLERTLVKRKKNQTYPRSYQNGGEAIIYIDNVQL